MPTYSYACTVCDNRFDMVQSFDEDQLTVCPECGGRLRQLFSQVGIVFKGSGFYRTDSRAESKSGGASSGETSGGKSGDATSGGKSGGSGAGSSSGSAGSSGSSGATKSSGSAAD